MFINQAGLEPFDRMDPDALPIGEDRPRSAILHGPAGTGKTSIVRSLAGIIGWNYIELHPSHFVAEGLNFVQKRADEIFQLLMQLDHTIILFDEIDELVRAREDKSADMFGRFLTTSMLPKLAELWKSRKVMYFVATNHIEYFDRAITRSERFDAAIFVSTPSFETKKRKIEELLRQLYELSNAELSVSQKDIDSAMDDLTSVMAMPEQDLKMALAKPWNKPIAKLALLRYDEIPELAYQISRIPLHDGVVDSRVLEKALLKLRDGRSNLTEEYYEFRRGLDFIRQDLSKEVVWKVGGLTQAEANAVLEKQQGYFFQKAGAGVAVSYFLATTQPDWDKIRLEDYAITKSGVASLTASKVHKAVSEKPADVVMSPSG